jgi:hypothetical protein
MNTQISEPDISIADLEADLLNTLDIEELGNRAALVPVAKPEVQTVSHVHEAIMNWMIANPTLQLRDCAAYFGYTQSWLSTIIHSDCFKARLKEKQDAVFNVMAEDLGSKLHALADVSIEKLTQAVEASSDPRLLKESAELALKSLGFGNKPGGIGSVNGAQNVQQNFYVASPADLQAARGMIQSAAPPAGSAQGEALLIPEAPAAE